MGAQSSRSQTLHRAWFDAVAKGKCQELIELCREEGVSVNVQDSQGWTAVITAASLGTKDCLDLLVKLGADLDVADKRGWTAVTHAAYEGRSTCLKLLLESGASLNTADLLGTTMRLDVLKFAIEARGKHKLGRPLRTPTSNGLAAAHPSR